MAYASLTSTPVLPRVIGPARARGFRRTAGRRGDDRGEVPPQRNLQLAFAFEGDGGTARQSGCELVGIGLRFAGLGLTAFIAILRSESGM